MSNENENTEFEKKQQEKVAQATSEIEEAAADNPDASTAEATEPPVEAAEQEAIDIKKLTQNLEEQAVQCEQLKDQLLRVRADFDNYRKRMIKEMNQVRQTASVNLIRALLPAMDNLERALAHASAEEGFVEGVGMVYKQLQEILANEGLDPVPALHEPFDPNVHDALATAPSQDVESGRIVEEFERGYRIRDMVLRPAKVIVSSGSPENNTEKENDAEATQQEVASE